MSFVIAIILAGCLGSIPLMWYRAHESPSALRSICAQVCESATNTMPAKSTSPVELLESLMGLLMMDKTHTMWRSVSDDPPSPGKRVLAAWHCERNLWIYASASLAENGWVDESYSGPGVQYVETPQWWQLLPAEPEK